MHLIVGVDPGKTSAIACLDLDGRLVFTEHKTHAGIAWIISAIESVGVPSVISCDREPDDTVRKIGAAFNARLFYPKAQMTVDEKREMAKPFGITNQHERDACAAAVKAYRSYSNKLHQAGHTAKQKNVSDIDGIKAKVIGKYSIEEAINKKEANRR